MHGRCMEVAGAGSTLCDAAVRRICQWMDGPEVVHLQSMVRCPGLLHV